MKKPLLILGGLFLFALFWNLFGDFITGTNQTAKRMNVAHRECYRLLADIESQLKEHKTLPASRSQIKLSNYYIDGTPSSEAIGSNYVFAFHEAGRALASGQTNVPVVFQKVRYYGKWNLERVVGGNIGFLEPREIMFFDVEDYKRLFVATFGTAPTITVE